MKKIVLAASTAMMLALSLGAALADQPEDLHCPTGGTKVESGAAGNGIVLPAGTLVCVKAGPGNTGIVTADGTSTLQEILFQAGIVDGSGEQGRDVSYYVAYSSSSPTPSPSPEPSPSVSPTPEPEPSEEPPAPSEEPPAPSGEPSAVPGKTLPLPKTGVRIFPFAMAILGLLALCALLLWVGREPKGGSR